MKDVATVVKDWNAVTVCVTSDAAAAAAAAAVVVARTTTMRSAKFKSE